MTDQGEHGAGGGQATLRRTEARYRALFEAASDAIFLLHSDRFIDCNPRAEVLFGLDRKDLLGHSPADFSPPVQADGTRSSEQARRKIAAALAGEVQRFDWRHRKGDGSILDTEIVLNRIEAAGDDTLLAVVRDVTERRRIESALRASRASLRSLASKITEAEDAERLRIAEGLHHSAVQNLAAAVLLMRQARARLGEDDGGSLLDEAAQLVEQTVGQLRDLSWDLSPPSLSQLGLEAAIEDALDRFAASRGIACSFRDDGQRKDLPVATRSVVYRSVGELLANAAKHAAATRVRVEIRRRGDRLEVEVVDDGRGFQTAGASEGFHARGGFGLFTIRERLRALGGRLQVESVPGDGTRATLQVPLDGAAEKAGLP